MKHLRNPVNGQVFAFAADGSDDAFIPSGLILMSDAEFQDYLSTALLPDSSDIDAERDRRIDAGIDFLGVKFQSRATDRENIAGAAQLAFMAVIAGAEPGDLRWSSPDADFAWIASDNTLVPMDAQTVMAFGKAAAERKQQLIFAARQLKDMAETPVDYTDDKWWP